MRIALRIVVFSSFVLAATAAGAQDCADLERRFGTQPLLMLGFLDRARCLGDSVDAEPVTLRVLRLAPKGEVARALLPDAPLRAAAALREIGDYVAEAMPEHGPRARALLAALAEEIESVRSRVAERLPLGEQSVKGWEWDGNTAQFRGLPTLEMTPLNETCAAPTEPKCRDAAAAGKVVFRAAALVRVVLRFSLEEVYQQALEAARVRDAKWTRYFDDARLQFPWELYVNGLRHARENRKAGGFADVPDDQWIVLHPGVGLEYVRDAPRGSRFEPALVVELIGYNRWRWRPDGRMGTALGISLIQTYSDRAGLQSARSGIMLHYDHKYSLALTRGDGETGLMLSVDLSRLVDRVGDEARERFRLLGSGRGAE